MSTLRASGDATTTHEFRNRVWNREGSLDSRRLKLAGFGSSRTTNLRNARRRAAPSAPSPGSRTMRSVPDSMVNGAAQT